MGSSNEALDEGDTNSIKLISCNNCMDEIVQYDSDGNIIYYIRLQKSLFDKEGLTAYDKYEQELGFIEITGRKRNINHETYIFYDENKQIIKYIEKNEICCCIRFTFYDSNKNVESIVNIQQGCCKDTIDEYDKYNNRTNYAIGHRTCCDVIYFENDLYGNPLFKIKFLLACSGKFKIYDFNNMEINLADKTIFNDSFTKIQQALILFLFFEKSKQGIN